MTRLLLTLAAIGIVGYGIFFALFGSTSYTWHQRLTVIVDTPAGQVQGAAVTEVRVVQIVGVLTLAQGLHTYVNGEAAVVEVLPGRFLFALLTSEDTRPMGDAGAWAYTAFDLTNRIAQGSMTSFQVTKTLSDEPRDTPIPLPSQGMPLLVTFDDISDPTTVRLVDPTNLSASFGPGVSLAGVTLEITGADVTEGRVEAFPFWPILRQQITFSGLQFYDPTKPEPLNYLTWKVLKMEQIR